MYHKWLISRIVYNALRARKAFPQGSSALSAALYLLQAAMLSRAVGESLARGVSRELVAGLL